MCCFFLSTQHCKHVPSPPSFFVEDHTPQNNDTYLRMYWKSGGVFVLGWPLSFVRFPKEQTNKQFPNFPNVFPHFFPQNKLSCPVRCGKISQAGSPVRLMDESKFLQNNPRLGIHPQDVEPGGWNGITPQRTWDLWISTWNFCYGFCTMVKSPFVPSF